MKIKRDERWLNKETGKYACPFCGKEYTAMGICMHIWKAHTESGHENTKNVNKANIGRPGWNKGLTKETDERIAKYAESVKAYFDEHGHNWKGRHHTDETKRKLSERQTAYLKENPDQHPYRKYHYSKGESPAEKYFREVFENEGIEFETQVSESIYVLDFKLFGEKIDFEVDGDQHYNDERIVESDKRRTEYLESNGWKVIRVRWSEWQKMPKESKRDFVNSLRNLSGGIA